MERVGNAFKGIIAGIIFVLIGIVLLWWNEGNNVRNLKTTAELSKNVIDVSSSSVDSKNEGKLIATNGELINEEELTDSTFGVTIKTPKMERVVEVYQWKEDSDTDDDGNTTYRYEKTWDSDLIDSSNFHQSGHSNPTSKPYENEEYYAKNVKVGAFSLAPDQIESLSTNANYRDFKPDVISKLHLSISGDYITTSKNVESPEIGDVRILFVYNDSTTISVLAVQSGNSFKDFVSSSNKTVNRVMDGTKSSAEMISVIKSENNFLKWLFRFLGTIFVMVGISAILKPISAITSFIPILGNVVNSAVGLVSMLLGLAVSLFIIGVAWIRYRPLLGISLLAIVVGIIVLLVTKGKKGNNNQANQTITNEQPIINQPQVSNEQSISQPTINNQVQNTIEQPSQPSIIDFTNSNNNQNNQQ